MGNIMLTVVQLAESATVGSALTFDRAVATVAAILALAGTITGGLALFRSTGREGPRRSLIALTTGSAGTLISIWVLATADGGPGTGNGVVAGYAGVAFGLIAVVLGGLALTRSRRRT
jgi:hypothetical protein